ncbi:hypothetical protein STSP2_01747 [Anaerohalosphaera lusitana]|uniref:Uncharacterized protein n=1 Tax=Anaerohalosphaera lusitana TaxID=1936003 RepID=A0A1U9NKZ5_9BACT|nr:hypothetical protein [Anaerohalosphaera lusitana]AQT68579.1 hypothetical protein STSP2_01747 [Anaerohalosphaera lusitana]
MNRNKKIEGTYILDGMLEGYITDANDEECLRRFLRQAKECKLHFHLSTEGERFTLLPDKKTNRLPQSVESVSSLLKHPLENLLACFAADDAVKFISTLRSIEYSPDTEKQALYCIGPDGGLMIEQRSVPADTVPPAAEMPLEDKLKIGAAAFAILAIVVGISAFFVPYGKIASDIYEGLKPYKIEDVSVQAENFHEYFTVEDIDRDRQNNQLILLCRKTPEFPASADKLNEQWLQSRDNLYAAMAVEALARKSLSCEYFDKEGELIGRSICRMRDIDDQPQLFAVALPFNRSIKKIEIRY